MGMHLVKSNDETAGTFFKSYEAIGMIEKNGTSKKLNHPCVSFLGRPP